MSEMTAAERYARIKKERQDAKELFETTSPSGMVWKLRKPDIQQFLINGTIPMSLAGNLKEALEKAGGDQQAAFASLDWKDQARSIEIDNFLVRYCAVSPRIVEYPQGDDEVGFDIELDDYRFILQWALKGGEEAESLDTFPSE